MISEMVKFEEVNKKSTSEFNDQLLTPFCFLCKRRYRKKPPKTFSMEIGGGKSSEFRKYKKSLRSSQQSKESSQNSKKS